MTFKKPGRIVLLLILSSIAMFTNAHEFSSGEITIDHPWANVTPPGVPNGAVYMTVSFSGSEPDKLVSAQADVSDRVELHIHEMKDGMMQMRKLDGVDLPSATSTVFAPGGLHVMLIGLKEPLAAGNTFPMTLNFMRNEPVKVEVVVGGPDNG